MDLNSNHFVLKTFNTTPKNYATSLFTYKNLKITILCNVRISDIILEVIGIITINLGKTTDDHITSFLICLKMAIQHEASIQIMQF